MKKSYKKDGLVSKPRKIKREDRGMSIFQAILWGGLAVFVLWLIIFLNTQIRLINHDIFTMNDPVIEGTKFRHYTIIDDNGNEILIEEKVK